ncbi:hypothetical protein OUZ56_003609 [Daphnia magna]|uniref:Uncharacterized protein n=1 Tax=Daphnia magna TaxID=35525 RepID=A0ABR0A9L9_9CRUS|nr:hypothetical protein OUZ56_003609 [Daphnia magna]
MTNEIQRAVCESEGTKTIGVAASFTVVSSSSVPSLGALTPFRKFPIGYSLDTNSPHRNPETVCSSGKTDD